MACATYFTRKTVLHELRTHGYKWDDQLLPEHVAQWNRIANASDGSETRLPGKIIQIGVPSKLFLITDASKRCMATCAYLTANDGSHLATAKSKLQSLKSNTTNPKLELNALTMAARLAYTSCAALKNHLGIERTTILSERNSY
ncbi:Elongation factor 2 [Parelaphostrongylus tenuis]|uniref:Elongation factor 2 n=1 Tax=Parelaphostrongylus tenuis TaxID=148309 RepID=A0AAD5MIK8_PARTN|nr:Elongation factor 2 [Parelaphostrongylus tenuis]